jgi:4-aminobutyrate aminotransferase-like enzyme
MVPSKYRKIRTLLSTSVENKYEPLSMTPMYPMVWASAKDYLVRDKNGNRWIDFTSTILTTNAGHGNKAVIRAISKCMRKPLLHSYLNLTEERERYTRLLCEKTGFEKVMLLSSGTESVECALRLIRERATGKGLKGTIYGLPGSFHGRTLGAMALSNKNPDVAGIEPLTVMKDTPIGFVFSPYEGWSGRFHNTEYIRQLCDLTHNAGGVVCCDEMQSGFGRTGKFFGYEHYGINPDLICIGKGMSGSLPLSGVLGPASILDLFKEGEMSSTHSGNPLSCAAGYATLQEITTRNLTGRSRVLGYGMHKFLATLRMKYPYKIKEVNGNGLMAGVVFNSTIAANVVCDRCFRDGLLVIKTGMQGVKLAPPLTIHEDALIEGLKVFANAVRSL